MKDREWWQGANRAFSAALCESGVQCKTARGRHMPERFVCFYGEGPSDRCWCVAVNVQCNCVSVKNACGNCESTRTRAAVGTDAELSKCVLREISCMCPF